MNGYRYDFEKPIAELEHRLHEARKAPDRDKHPESLKTLEAQLEQLKRKIYSNLTPWQRVQLARHPQRPYTLDYCSLLLSDFTQVHGDRLFSDDRALVGGIGKLDGRPCIVLGHQKGRDTKENLMRNFGSAHPEGYRKALRLMRLGEKFHLPVLIFIDTPGAYPGIGAEERGQAHSIAYNMREMARLRTAIYVCVIGEGGSGGALGIGVGDWTAMFENAYYSVISPEGCAAILWRDRARAPEAAAALKLTSNDLLALGIVDEVIEEPLGGVHRDPEMVAQRLRASILRFLKLTDGMPLDALIERRYERFRRTGACSAQQLSAVSPPPSGP
ncbi:MAG: acetyl-CoA carboxylase carboxyltransferase subunit alpha [Candidatus Omnitrophica bacterium]|nr:acetyl-CoA carboxylase carboxyltransferase subunit alpha [Candidatus Omnitrophota bacterium]MBI2494998.1 acetyl-CoA carboxylase carboxyltransferase subunit alpha [Candidatus Omnitrophota bacterium]MBI3021253.1 acetyl-CoA carboxylase carboxyltransferase subunit alpha [Candidatus Omnitrophota bacterium]MBI3082850.1 acetyl-CoA carboxylase carboxyltransferase subunit alpha [Candidatus Omnitrophota bacterium]